MTELHDSRFTAVLLAGGRSRRMGRDKASVLVRGQELWRRQMAVLRATEPWALLISGRPDGPYAGEGIEIVPDLLPGFGPLSGLHAALHRAETDCLLVMAIDLADMEADFLRSLTAVAGGRAVIPRGERWFEPLAALYTRECLPLVEECLAGNDLSLQNLVRRAIEQGIAQARPLRDNEMRLFRNVNTPADL